MLPFKLETFKDTNDNDHLKSVNRICGVSHRSDASVRIDEGVLTAYDVSITGLGVRLLVPGDGVADAVIVGEPRMPVLFHFNRFFNQNRFFWDGMDRCTVNWEQFN